MDSDLARGLRAAVEGSEPSSRVWERIDSRTGSGSLSGFEFMRLYANSIPARIAMLLVVFAAGYGIWNLVQSDGSDPDGLRSVTFDSETVPLVQVGDDLVSEQTGPAHSGQSMLSGDAGTVPGAANQPLIQVPLEFETVDSLIFERALEQLASTPFSVRSVQVGRNREITHIFDQRMDDYWDGSNLPFRQLVQDDTCVTSPIDVPEAGTKTICQLFARADGTSVGESFSMPVYRVTEATYSPSGEVTVRVDDRSSTVFSINRTTVYQGMVDLWRLVDGEVEYRAALSTGNFDLLGNSEWRSTGTKLETGSGAEIVEWLLAMQMPDSDFAGNNLFEERFTPGSTFDRQHFYDLNLVQDPDDSVLVIEARRDLGFYGGRYRFERRSISGGEMLRFEIDRETGRLERLLVTTDSNIPYALQFSFVLPIVFEFEYEE